MASTAAELALSLINQHAFKNKNKAISKKLINIKP